MTPPVEHDTIAAVVAELRDILKDAGESTNSDPAQNYLNVWLIDRLERIDAEMRKDREFGAHVLDEQTRIVVDLRAKLAACERREPPHCPTCDCGTPP